MNDISKGKFLGLRKSIIAAGYGEEIVWQESLTKCDTADEFMGQYIWVVISSGMKNQVARIIEQRIFEALNNNQPISTAFKHKGKVKAIEYMIRNHNKLFSDYQKTDNQLEFLKALPYIGDITKYHLAKNLGEDVVKPDRHLVRIAEQYKTTPLQLCKRLAEVTGYRLATVDLIIWRAANLGMI